MRRTFNRFLPSAFIVTLSLGAARVAFSDGPSDTPRMPVTACRGAKRAVVGCTANSESRPAAGGVFPQRRLSARGSKPFPVGR